jgi:ABC-2 type transport system permease protein
VKRTRAKFAAIAHASFALWTEYRAELLLWALTHVTPIIMLGVWYRAGQSGKLPLSPDEFVRYFLGVFVIRQATVVWVIWEFESHVVQGTLSPLLLQPMNPVWRFVVQHLTERVVRMPFSIAIIAVILWLYPGARWTPSVESMLLATAAILAAFATRFIIQYAFAMVGFWSERASSIEELWFLFYLFLSGVIAPLELYPHMVRVVAELTPFPYLVYFPTQLLLGKPVLLAKGFAVLGAWAVLGLIVQRVLWKRGLRHYSAMGA